VVEIFERAGYAVEPTAPYSSTQNGPGERPHQTIAQGIRTLLGGAALPPKYWPYALNFFLRIYNSTVHDDDVMSPFERCTGEKPNLRKLRTFGCRMYALPRGSARSAKARENTTAGIFLGYSNSMHNVIYLDLKTNMIKTAQHVEFDELMTDTKYEDRSPNAQLLDGARKGKVRDIMDMEVDYPISMWYYLHSTSLLTSRCPTTRRRTAQLP